MESMVAVGGVLEEEDWRIRDPQLRIIGFIVLGEVNMSSPLYLLSTASEALSPKDHVERPLSRHHAISEAAVAPRFTQLVQDPEEGSR